MIKKIKNKIELLAPAGNIEKLKIAISYGANAIYLGGKNFNLRNFSDNFSIKEMYKAREITYKNKIKMYVAVNIYSKNNQNSHINKYLRKLNNIKPDGIIIADPGVFIQTQKLAPNIPIHISTQANITNTNSALFWKKLGAQRINMARELTIQEIKEIISDSKMEVEAFVHGAMCIAYSGRCLLSTFMENRESNLGMCCQPCRFKYTVMESKKPGKHFPIFEDKLGSYIFNSKDLCMINYISNLINIGIKSLKIEGRMKSINYLATTTKAYREAINAHYNKYQTISQNKLKLSWKNQLNSINNRKYCTGFYFKNSNQTKINLDNNFNPGCLFVGEVIKKTQNKYTLINVKNKIFVGDKVNIISSSSFLIKQDRIKNIFDEKGMKCKFIQPGANANIQLNNHCNVLDLIQKY